MTSITTTRPADATFVVYDEPRWETQATVWTGIPGAKVPLNLGGDTAVYRAIFVATFSAEALAEGTNGLGCATVFFGNTAAEPVSDNHRYVTTRSNPEWSSHTFVRTIKFDTAFDLRDVTAEVRVKVVGADTKLGIQNWVLKVERFNY
ncbi:hypothetical protein BDZ94DRAFT_1268353 [Collybia nuda]|uniref:Uncharacterized protein n=1 Tax=Collybia nuda TaxID=64659 RepID=A0A9P5Y122_9AGAR|nr:hypothetical protein BDZ94DRAFT_1268353 [Collybia nuda]